MQLSVYCLFPIVARLVPAWKHIKANKINPVLYKCKIYYTVILALRSPSWYSKGNYYLRVMCNDISKTNALHFLCLKRKILRVRWKSTPGHRHRPRPQQRYQFTPSTLLLVSSFDVIPALSLISASDVVYPQFCQPIFCKKQVKVSS